jgi:predicted chitinase
LVEIGAPKGAPYGAKRIATNVSGLRGRSYVSDTETAASLAVRRLTARQLTEIAPDVGTRASDIAPVLASNMAEFNFNNIYQQAAFIGQMAVESQNFTKLTEGLYYTTAARLMEVFPSKFKTVGSTQPYLRNPEGLANYAYAGRNGNGNVASGDGYRFRGGGFIQVTGRANYRVAGYEDNPDALRTLAGATTASVRWWVRNGLLRLTTVALNQTEFRAITVTVNGRAALHASERWRAYQRALVVFRRTTEESER